MEQKDFDIYEILKGVPIGTKLYTPMCGKVGFAYLATNKEAGEAIWTTDNNGEYTFNKNGRWMEGGEVMLFPSDRMRDWSKFAWKPGDVLVNKDGNVHIIFDGFEDDTYKNFHGKNYLWEEGGSIVNFEEDEDYMQTSDFNKANKEDAQEYIHKIEKELGGKLNRETLEIEKPAKPVFELGNLYVFNEQDEDGELTIIGKLIGKDESYDTLTFGNQYEIENEKFVTDQAFDLRISVHDELREATEGEAVTFQEACTLWEKSKEKKRKEQPDFKPFDKVLVRNGGKCKWIPAFFVRDRGEDFAWRYNVLPLHRGKPADFTACISYEGNEHLAFTDCDTENPPF
ncbi:hypothetical protein [Segatella copri]|uniref:hypothetical protein n=1 Tax=Segatella copri TaxID=165179 RepID=UPI001C45921D|nr:hypothetical protein [Segatella copri]MBW0023574.1 hypothetical protein [Segatella copri]MCP9539549.1 hypothetical protein [Segatella copri]